MAPPRVITSKAAWSHEEEGTWVTPFVVVSGSLSRFRSKNFDQPIRTGVDPILWRVFGGVSDFEVALNCTSGP